MKNIGRIVLTFGLLAVPAVALAQTDDPQKKSEIRVGKLDVIYEEEEFKGIKIDQCEEEETQQIMYQSPFIVRPADDDEEGVLQPFSTARRTSSLRLSTLWPYTCRSSTRRASRTPSC